MFWKFSKKTGEKGKTSKIGIDSPKTELPLDFLQKLIPLGELTDADLQILEAGLRNFSPGQIIFNRGESADSLLYLYSGHVFMEAANGNGYMVDEATFKANYPLSTHTEHQFNAIAKSATKIAYLPLSALQRCSQTINTNNPLINTKNIPPNLLNSEFFKGFCAAFRRNDLHVPSLPDVAIKLRSALQKESICAADAVKIINLDPVITSKLIQMVNSPLYRSINPITNSHDAITRLGLKTTQNLATSISLRNLFRSHNKLLNNRVQQLWKHSIQIASLSYALASLTQTINPDEALLAGLIHNIGALPIITYAGSLKDDAYTAEELDQSLSVLQGLVGVAILEKWHFPENLLQIPKQTGNWYHDDNPELQMGDIVLLAKFHDQLGSSKTEKLPPLNTLPAFLKLGDNALTPDMSLSALQEAKQQIAEALSFFRT